MTHLPLGQRLPSSILPLQSLSMPSQTSTPGLGAEQAPHLPATQTSWPGPQAVRQGLLRPSSSIAYYAVIDHDMVGLSASAIIAD